MALLVSRTARISQTSRASRTPRSSAAIRRPGATLRSRSTWLFAACGVALWVGAPATAQIYRCEGPDGVTTYTSSPETCGDRAGTEIQLREDLLSSGGEGGSSTGTTITRPPSFREGFGLADGEGAAEIWRSKKQRAEEDLRNAEDLAPRYQRATVRCRRSGGDAWYEDKDGIKHPVSCQRLEDEFQRLTAEQKRLQAYLNGGLAEECRRAGCLPGWIR